MKNKNEVYVVLDTPKKANKLKKVLDMFGESYLKTIKDPFRNCFLYFDSEVYYDTSIYKDGCYTKCKSEVSIKELRNILAVEHLKEGDIIIVKNASSKWIIELTGNNLEKFEHTLSLDLKDNCFSDNKWTITNGNFIRYANEAEKELLRVNSLKEQAKEVVKPVKKELESGKWYFVDRGSSSEYRALVLFQGHGVRTYGFSHGYDWTSIYGCDDTFKNNSYKYSEATTQEVEQALIEEAKRRGFKGGFVFDDRTNILWNQQENGEERAFLSNGKWATIIEQPTDKFAELKEAHSKGAVIQFYCDILEQWCDCHKNNPSWDKQEQYRIKPEEKPKVGDIVKAWDNDERDFVIGKLNDIDDSIYPFTVGSRGFKNAKKITPQEAKELLTDYCR